MKKDNLLTGLTLLLPPKQREEEKNTSDENDSQACEINSHKHA